MSLSTRFLEKKYYYYYFFKPGVFSNHTAFSKYKYYLANVLKIKHEHIIFPTLDCTIQRLIQIYR